MLELDGEGVFEDDHARRQAVKNASQIKQNILKLIHRFRADQMQAKLSREFRDASNSRATNDIGQFATVFE